MRTIEVKDMGLAVVYLWSLACTALALLAATLSITFGEEAGHLLTYGAISFVGILGCFVGIALSSLTARVAKLEKIITQLQQSQQ